MIAIRRIIKQSIYVALSLGLIALVLFIVIIPSMNLFRRDPAPPPPPRESIIIESVDTITHDSTIDLIARVRNPNPRAGVPDYTLVFILLDEDGQEITTISQPTYLLPGGMKSRLAWLPTPATLVIATSTLLASALMPPTMSSGWARLLPVSLKPANSVNSLSNGRCRFLIPLKSSSCLIPIFIARIIFYL